MKKLKAFTLVELIMAVSILGIISSLAVPLIFQVARSYTTTVIRRDLAASALTAIQRLDRDLRRLKSDTQVISASSSAYEFYDQDNNLIRYQLSGGQIQRLVNGAVRPLANDVSALSFAYYSDSLTAIPAPTVSPAATNIKFVEASFTLTRGTQSLPFKIRVKLQNVSHS